MCALVLMITPSSLLWGDTLDTQELSAMGYEFMSKSLMMDSTNPWAGGRSGAGLKLL